MPNLRYACCAAQRGKRPTEWMDKVNAEPDRHLSVLQKQLHEHTFTTSPYHTFILYEKKRRVISKLPYYPDRIVHHALMRVLAPVWEKTFIADVYSSIPGRGIHDAVRRVQSFLQHPHDVPYCLQFDIRQFYPSVNQDILMDRVRQKIKCADTLWLIDDIVRSPDGSCGLPIGNYTSQYLAIVYLDLVDQWIKRQLRCRFYVRYADDGVILSGSKKRLHAIRDALAKKLHHELRLELNQKTQVYPVADRGIDFLGYRIFPRYILLRKRAVRAFRRTIRRIKTRWPAIPPDYVVGSIMSRMGWLSHCDCHNLAVALVYSDQRLMRILDEACRQLQHANPLLAYKEAL